MTSKKSLPYEEPVLGETFVFALIPREELYISPYQRDLSSTFVNKLLNSVGKGFIMPVIAVESPSGLEVIDGQHRLAALEKTLAHEHDFIPTIILPSAFRDYPLFYNIEKGDNIKDKATKLWMLYKDKTAEQPELTERQLAACANYEPYLFTIAFAFCEAGLKSPSLVETVVKKLDNKEIVEILETGVHEPLALEESMEERRLHAARAVDLEAKINEIAETYGFTDFNLKKSIISTSTQTLWGRKRKLDVSFDEGMDASWNKSRQPTGLGWAAARGGKRMSRTWHHNMERLFWAEDYPLEEFNKYSLQKTLFFQKKRIVLRHDKIYSGMPKWWVRDFHTKKRRSQERAELHRALWLDPLDRIWPLHKKPQIYYW